MHIPEVRKMVEKAGKNAMFEAFQIDLPSILKTPCIDHLDNAFHEKVASILVVK